MKSVRDKIDKTTKEVYTDIQQKAVWYNTIWVMLQNIEVIQWGGVNRYVLPHIRNLEKD